MILLHPNDVLRKRADDVTSFDDELSKLVDCMLDEMYTSNGIGLAAPQVGCSKRIIIVDASCGERASSLRVLVNPVITDYSPEKSVDVEGCLSLPGQEIYVERSDVVMVDYRDVKGNQRSEPFIDVMARIVQHEIDHLDGVLMIDRKFKGKL